MNKFTPYTSEDITLEFCKEQAKELKASGKYAIVVTRHKKAEPDGRKFARNYVLKEREGEI
jgi:N-acetylmuramoyl-L-alanine amidase